MQGLSSDEAARRFQQYGPNEVPSTEANALRRMFSKLWAPIPWMLETAVVFELALGRYVEALIIVSLVVFNAVLGFIQEGRAQETLNALKSRLAVMATVLRDGKWTRILASVLVTGDVVKLELGAIVPADVNVLEGRILLDESMLTGESIPVEASPGRNTFAGALVRRGEALAEVTAIGAGTKFGRTAELVRTAHSQSSEEKAVVRVVRNLAVANGGILILLVSYARAISVPFVEIVPLILTGILASIPVALPATFTLASALGARRLARQGVLPTRLSAVHESATMDVLCTDKTGTLTQNQLSVMAVRPMRGFTDSEVLALAALASSDNALDPVDSAVCTAASERGSNTRLMRTHLTPFDPATKTSEATAIDAERNPVRIVKGAYDTVMQEIGGPPSADAEALQRQGFRVLGIAIQIPHNEQQLAGLIALSDIPRSDSARMIGDLHGLGVRTVMVTGDAAVTAEAIGRAVGLSGAVFGNHTDLEEVDPEKFAIFAGVLPEGKYRLVKVLQKHGHTVGMCGDGANDAPALRQAQMGIAVSTATDAAKSAAGIVLTEPGLGGILAAVREGRMTFERVFTYALNSILKKVVQVLLLAVGLVMTRASILTPLQMVIVMVTNDFLTMSLTTERASPSVMPNRWRVGSLTAAGAVLGLCDLAFCSMVLAVGKFQLGLDATHLQTLAFVALVTGSQAMLYCIRDRRRLWSRPSPWLIASSCADIGIIFALAILGVAMRPLSGKLVGCTLVAAIAFGLLMNSIKFPLFARLKLA